MSTILRAEEFSFLHGKEVIQICFGLYQIQMHLSKDVSIYWEHDFDHNGHGTRSADIAKTLSRNTTLLSLLGQTVDGVVTGTDNALTLKFSNGEVLAIFVNGGSYESISIIAPGKNIVA